MIMRPDISIRRLEPELMDDPALETREHLRALRGLRLVNRVSRTAHVLWGPIRALAGVPGHPPVRVLDIATGSGDVPLALARLARKQGIRLTVDGCDQSERALDLARARAGESGAESRFFRMDAIREALPGDYDVLMCSLFMHHLSEQDGIELLYRMRAAARRMVLVSDLRRSTAGLALAWVASRVFSRSRVMRTDAILSVRAAYTIDEFRGLAHEAGLDGAAIRAVWPQRFLLEWRRP
jgi:2-polyprenyl-3-methyl-5-hydroxy-6-metoxy-1,4-benzoquinol methylase